MVSIAKLDIPSKGIISEENDQKRRVLSGVLWIMLVMALAIGFINLRLGAIPESIALFAAAAVSVPALLLNRLGRYDVAAGAASLMVLLTLDFNLWRAGGIHDPGVVTIPLFVMLGPLLFSRRALPIYVIAALVSVIAIGAMEIPGEAPSAQAKTVADISVISLLTLGSGLMAWLTIGRLEENVQRARRSERRLEEAYERTLEGWSKALEHRDLETHGHTRRVVSLCTRLAAEWGYNEDDLARIRHGALLHDIGKLAVPDSILLKEGPLNSSELRVMQRHPDVALWMLSEIPYLQSALAIPASHHERWDGSGYPKGLRGPEIPLEARIFAVVDTFDALTSNRPYRRAWPTRKALNYVRDNAGRIFDPDVCAAFIRLYEAHAFDKAE